VAPACLPANAISHPGPVMAVIAQARVACRRSITLRPRDEWAGCAGAGAWRQWIVGTYTLQSCRSVNAVQAASAVLPNCSRTDVVITAVCPDPRGLGARGSTPAPLHATAGSAVVCYQLLVTYHHHRLSLAPALVIVGHPAAVAGPVPVPPGSEVRTARGLPTARHDAREDAARAADTRRVGEGGGGARAHTPARGPRSRARWSMHACMERQEARLPYAV